MKKALLLLVLLIGAASVFALPLNVGQSQFNIGTGFSTWGMPIYMGVDYGVTPDITLGGEATLRFDKHGSWVGIYGNGNYHFVNLLNMPSNTDFYAGLCLGFDVWLPDDGHENAHNSGLGLGVQVGGRYYFNDRLGLNLEFGGGFVSGGKIGISCKL